jgi:hypothetical protein
MASRTVSWFRPRTLWTARPMTNGKVMRNISFMLTQQQILARTKTVTRRVGWAKLKAGDLLRGVEKGMGLKSGEKVRPFATFRVVSVRAEPLSAMTTDLDYGFVECRKEGFSGHDR